MLIAPAFATPPASKCRPYRCHYDALFTKDKPIIFAFHGYPTLVHELTYERTNRNLSVHGYQEEGAITTPFDMRVQERDRPLPSGQGCAVHLPQLGNRGAYLIQQMNDKLVAHKNYIHKIRGYAEIFGLEVSICRKTIKGFMSRNPLQTCYKMPILNQYDANRS